MSDHLAIILVGFFAAGASSLLGCFLILRRMGMMGDAISHAVLPGIVVAYLLTGSRDSLPMLAGAAAFGLFAAIAIEFLHRRGNIQRDASIGITFTALFALGVLLVSRYAGQVDLDMDCVLHGEIGYVPLNRLEVSGEDVGPRALWILGTIHAINAAFLMLFWKQLKITTFDPVLATVMGMAGGAVHYALLGLTALTSVAAFESVGAILIVAMMIVPAATAYLVTERLVVMLLLSQLFSATASAAGYGLAVRYDVSIAGMMVVVAGIQLILAVCWSLWEKRSAGAPMAAPRQNGEDQVPAAVTAGTGS